MVAKLGESDELDLVSLHACLYDQCYGKHGLSGTADAIEHKGMLLRNELCVFHVSFLTLYR